MPYQMPWSDASGNVYPESFWVTSQVVAVSETQVITVGLIGYKDADAYAQGLAPIQQANAVAPVPTLTSDQQQTVDSMLLEVIQSTEMFKDVVEVPMPTKPEPESAPDLNKQVSSPSPSPKKQASSSKK